MPTVWGDSLLSETVAGGGTVDVAFLGLPTLSALQRRIERFTLTRTIIGIDIMANVRDSGEGDQVVDLGIGVFDNNMAVANFPNPAVEEEFPPLGWLWRARYRVYASAVDDQNVVRVRVDMNIKAQRKLQNGRPALVTTNTDVQGVATVILVTGLIRMLYLVG